MSMKRSEERKQQTERGPKVKNSKAVRKLAINTVRKNKGKSSVIIFAIALCSFLFTTLFTVAGNIYMKLRMETERQVGSSAMGAFKNLNEEEYEKAASDAKVKEVSRWIYLGEVVNPEMNKLRTEVHWSDEISAKKSFCYPEIGHMPEAEDELVTSDLVLKALGIEPKIGESVTLMLEMGQRKMEKTFTLCGCFKGDHISMAQVVLVSKIFQEKYAPTPSDSFYEENGKKNIEEAVGRIDADVDFYLPFQIKGQMEALARRAGLPEKVDIGINWASLAGTMDAQSLLLVAGILLTIFLSGYLMINNVYRINILADIRSYGLFKTIGMSGRQLKRLVKWQAVFLSIPGILIGTGAGIIAGIIVLPVVMGTMIFAETITAEADFHVWIPVFSALFSYFTVRLSCLRPARIAARISPIEAVQYLPEIKFRKGVLQSRKNVQGGMQKRSSFHTVFFALKNLGRDQRKVILVVLSLSLSLVVLNSVYSILHGFDEDKYIKSFVTNDFSVADATLDNMAVNMQNLNISGVTPQFFKALEKRKGIEGAGNIYLADSEWQDFSDEEFKRLDERLIKKPQLEEWMQMEIDEEGGTMQEYYESQKGGEASIYGMDSFVAKELPVLDGKIDWKKFYEGNYILVNAYSMVDEDMDEIEYFLPGEKISVQNADGKKREYEVMAVVELPYAMRFKHFSILDLCYVLPSDEFLDFFGERNPMRTLFDVEDEQEEDMEMWLSDYTTETEPSLSYSSKKVYKEQYKGFTQMLMLTGGLLTGILAVIGILNFMNAFVTSILARRLELAMMEAVGMTKRFQIRSICIEGLFYAGFTGVAGAILCTLFSVFLVRPFGAEIWFYTWKFTLFPVLFVLPVMVLAAVLIPRLIYRHVMKASVVERLRMAEM